MVTSAAGIGGITVCSAGGSGYNSGVVMTESIGLIRNIGVTAGAAGVGGVTAVYTVGSGNVGSVVVTESLGGNSFTADFFAAIFTLNNVVIRAAVYAICVNLVLNNGGGVCVLAALFCLGNDGLAGLDYTSVSGIGSEELALAIVPTDEGTVRGGSEGYSIAVSVGLRIVVADSNVIGCVLCRNCKLAVKDSCGISIYNRLVRDRIIDKLCSTGGGLCKSCEVINSSLVCLAGDGELVESEL